MMINKTQHRLRLKCGCVIEYVNSKDKTKRKRKFVNICFKHSDVNKGVK